MTEKLKKLIYVKKTIPDFSMEEVTDGLKEI